MEEAGHDNIFKKTGLFFVKFWKGILTASLPIILFPCVIFFDMPEVRCGYVVLIMAVYWMTECIPMAITSLLPVFLFPCLQILDTAATCACYMNDTIMVFIGGLILAIAIEHSELHMRIALGVMNLVGCSHRKLTAGLCVVTTFMSMWVTNTAATAMMIPIVFAVLQELEKEGIGVVFHPGAVDPDDPNSVPEPIPSSVTRAYLLAAAYTATFGGIGTLVGTGTNLVFKGIFESTFPNHPGINFVDWFLLASPQMLINTIIMWFYIQIGFMGMFRPNSADAKACQIGPEGINIANRVMKEKWHSLGMLTFHEFGVAILFLFCIFLWVFRHPGFMPGWSDLLRTNNLDIKDSVPVVMVTILMFIIPKNPNWIFSWSNDRSKRPAKASEGLITWKVIQAKMPWSLMFLLGGGFAISKGSTASCLAKWSGTRLVGLRGIGRYGLLGVVILFTGVLTDFTSNVGISNILLPIMAQMCVAMKWNPLFLMLPVTYTCSYAFRLPVGTPPNALIAFAGHIPTKDLIKAGCIPSIWSLLITATVFPVLGSIIYDVNAFPPWADITLGINETDPCDRWSV